MKKTIISFVLLVCTLFSCLIALPAAAEGEDTPAWWQYTVIFYPSVSDADRTAAIEKLKDDYNKKYNAEMTYTLKHATEYGDYPDSTDYAYIRYTYILIVTGYVPDSLSAFVSAARKLPEVWSVTGDDVLDTHLYGDANENRVLDLADLLVIKRMVMQSGDTSFVSRLGRFYSDINRNGKIDTVDYLLVKRMYLGTLALEWVK